MRPINKFYLALILSMGNLCAAAPPVEPLVPTALVTKLEAEYKLFTAKQEGVKKEGVRRARLDLGVEFLTQKRGALRTESRVELSAGSGTVDLAEIVTPLKGSFRVAFKPRDERGDPASGVRVFFIGGAKRRDVAGESYGDGCDKFAEITTAYRKRWATGLPVEGADRRYLSVLGGTFLFVDFTKEALKAAAVRFTDSRYPNLLCEG